MASVTRIGSDKEGMFSLQTDGQQIGSLTYVIADDARMIIEHTNVKRGHEGQGNGKLLLQAAAEFARGKEYKVTPTCSFAEKVMKASPDFADILE